jgi:GT2 family glycosyltransferase
VELTQPRPIVEADDASPSPTVVVGTREKAALAAPFVRGKFLYAGDEKLYLRGVTYGTFRPDDRGDEFPCSDMVERDFEAMQANGVNALRTYTAPPARVLDAAERHGLRVLVGLGAERYIGYLNDAGGARRIDEAVRRKTAVCVGHPAVLCYAVGNEIPAAIIRWFGRRRVERLLARLVGVVRCEDPAALVTYANYPSTEYLQLPFLDLLAFNVYLEDAKDLGAYAARLQNIAGDRPLVMTELGLDSVRHGEDVQAVSAAEQVRTAFTGGCAGAFVYSWTDEWHRGGEDVEDWAFGLTRRDRGVKPALAAVRAAFAETPFAAGGSWPRASVVVCTRNGAKTLRDCLAGLLELDYPDFEVLVVDDGSTDATKAIARAFPFPVINAGGRGLSHARNRGLEASTGEIVAYLDDDARPEPHWLRYIASTLSTTEHAGVGGPNIAPVDGSLVAQCVDKAPGLPTHVLLDDRVAEHIPGCNMAFRRDRLQAIGGFDSQFRTAGDDVDICWRLQARGWTIAFNAAATVFHHRRSSICGYLRQQFGYGAAEALLERKWPDKYNGAGSLSWRGRVYAGGARADQGRLRRARIAYGTWGTGLFQRLYAPPTGRLDALARSPEWYLVIAVLAALCALGAVWPPLLVVAPMLALALVILLTQATRAGAYAAFTISPRSSILRLRIRALITLLHLLGPAARLAGRITGGLTPWRHRQAAATIPWPRSVMTWSDRWATTSDRLVAVEATIRAQGLAVRRSGTFDRWDLEIRQGSLATVRLLMAVEENPGRTQVIRIRWWPRLSPFAPAAALPLAGLAAAASVDGSQVVAGVLAAGCLGVIAQTIRQCAAAAGVTMHALRQHAVVATGVSAASYLAVQDGSKPLVASRRVSHAAWCTFPRKENSDARE